MLDPTIDPLLRGDRYEWRLTVGPMPTLCEAHGIEARLQFARLALLPSGMRFTSDNRNRAVAQVGLAIAAVYVM